MDAVLTPPRHFSVFNLTSKCVWSSLLLHNPRRVLRSLSATLLLLFLSVLCVRTPLPVAGQPNLILIVRDDQKADALAFMPTVQRFLVDGGTLFNHAYAHKRLPCSPDGTGMEASSVGAVVTA